MINDPFAQRGTRRRISRSGIERQGDKIVYIYQCDCGRVDDQRGSTT